MKLTVPRYFQWEGVFDGQWMMTGDAPEETFGQLLGLEFMVIAGVF